MEIKFQVPKSILVALNQVYEIEQKLKKSGDVGGVQRNITKIKDAFEDLGFSCEDPMGQLFKETRTDLEATISGTGAENLIVVEVIKPIIRAMLRDETGEFSKVVQKGI